MNGSTGINVGDAVVTVQEFTYKTVSLSSGTSKDICGGRCILGMVWINTSPVAAVTITDGSNSPFVIPAGATVGPYPFRDVGMRTNMRITHTAGTGELTFVFKSF